jgi:hypothetical protein
MGRSGSDAKVLLPRPQALLLRHLNGEVDLLIVVSHRDFLSHLAAFAMIRFDGVGPGGNVRQLERPVFGTHREKRMIENAHISKHPGMNIALKLQ